MKTLTYFIVSVALLLGAWSAMGASIKNEEITYRADGTTLKGYIAYDSSIRGKRPGIIVVHEWWGLNEYVRNRARMLAELGYTALAVDMYGDGKTASHPEDAGKFAAETMKNFPQAKARFEAGIEVLKKHRTVDKKRIAAIGYCFGGGIVLNMARQGVELAGVASFHGSLGAVQPAEPGGIKTRIFAAHGGADSFIPEEQVEAFKKEMSDAGADLTFIVYPGATHSWTNPEADRNAKEFKMPVAYNPEMDRKSWEDLQNFLNEIFAKR
jgi:dienelactone hydrolase